MSAGAELAATVALRRARGFALSVRLDAAPGSTVAVLGPSGAGKSTLLAALAGLVRLDSGSIVLDGRVLSDARRTVAPHRRGTVLLGQDARLFPHLDARDNVAFGPRAGGMARGAARRLAEEWLERMGLAGAEAARPADLSGGQQQRVALARALAASPRLLLLDEPLRSLDPVTAAGIRAAMSEHIAGVTCVVVTHDLADAAALADRVLVLEAGRVTQEGSLPDVLAHPATTFVAALAALGGAGRA